MITLCVVITSHVHRVELADHGITRLVLALAMRRGRIAQTLAQMLIDSLVAKWVLRNQDQIRAARHARPEREVARMPAHHFDDLHPTMRAGRRARTLDDLG